MISAPTFLGLAGSAPSNPPWNPTVNLRKFLTSTPLKLLAEIILDASIVVEESDADADGWIKHASKLNAVLFPATDPLASGLK